MQDKLHQLTASSCLIDDFHCRLCLGSSDTDMQQLFPANQPAAAIDLASRIFECLAIHLSFTEEFCAVICPGCRDQVGRFFDFKKQCQSNNKYLRQKRAKHINETLVLGRIQQDLDATGEDQQGCRDRIKEPEEAELLEQAKDIFCPVVVIEEPVFVEEPVVGGDPVAAEAVVVVEQPTVVPNMPESGSSSEIFSGFPLEAFSRRSPRIFVRNSVKEAYERQQSPAKSDEKSPIQRQCKVALEKMDIKPNVEQLAKKRCPELEMKKIKKERLSKDQRSAKPVNKKAVLYYQGYEFCKPRQCPTGELLWSCSNTKCLVKLKRTAVEIGLSSNPHHHQPQVIREGTIMNKRRHRKIPYFLSKQGKRLSLVYNSSFRYQLSARLEGNRQLWACVNQPEACKSYMKIEGDFETILSITQHNHPADRMVVKGTWNTGRKAGAAS